MAHGTLTREGSYICRVPSELPPGPASHADSRLMPTTARRHFDDDFARATDLLVHARACAEEPLRTDLARCAVAFGVGALDAYLCDAFVDALARKMKQCRRDDEALPPGYAKLSIPAGPLLASYEARPNWGLRMAARAMMEKDNLLQLGRLKDLVNPVLPAGAKLWTDVAPAFIALDRKRLAGISASDYAALSTTKKVVAKRKAAAAVLRRIGVIVQRRHDIVHNCDRPKNAPQLLKIGSARNMLTDVGAFVDVTDKHIDANWVV